jgi:hypothetical protein
MDLPDLSSVAGAELSDGQIRGVLAQIDLDIVNLLRDGKLSALKYGLPGDRAGLTDRSSNLRALIAAREHYETFLQSRPAWETSQAAC